MKQFLMLFGSIFFFLSCAETTTNQSAPAVPDTPTDSILANENPVAGESNSLVVDSVKTPQQPTIIAQFKYFSLGDASHFVFQSQDGTVWDFGRNVSSGYTFAMGLPESEINERNQGWTSNRDLQGKWFLISYEGIQAPMYIDGPVGEVLCITQVTEVQVDEWMEVQPEGLTLKIKKQESTVKGFVHNSLISPDTNIYLESEEMEPSSYQVIIHSNASEHTVLDVALSPIATYWNESAKYVVLDNADTYANEGTYSVVVLNVESGRYIEVPVSQFSTGKDIGKMDRITVKKVQWVSENMFEIEVVAGYPGPSGHPGIDLNRKQQLGDKFGSKETVQLAHWMVEIWNDNTSALMAQSGHAETKPNYYVCFQEDASKELNLWVGYAANGEALEVKHMGQEGATPLTFVEDLTPTGIVNTEKVYEAKEQNEGRGQYKITHSGNYDYVVFTRASDGIELNYSIVHVPQTYGSTACF